MNEVTNDITPNPHTHPIITELGDAELVKLVEEIRTRRLRLNAMYMEVKRVKKDTSDAVLHNTIDKELVHFLKALSSVDKALIKAQLHANKIISTQIALGNDTAIALKLLSILKGEDK